MSFLKGGKNGGYDLLDEIEERIEANKAAAAAGGKTYRFWIKKGETRRVIFLTDNPPIIEEHNLKLNGKWGNPFTCLKNLGKKCPLCEAGDRPSTVGFYVIIDRTGYTKKDGTEVTDVVRVLPAKFNSLKQFKKFSLKYKGLKGIEFEVDRVGDKAPSIGDTWQKEDKHSDAALQEILGGKEIDEVIPDWEEYLAPKAASELATLASGKATETSDEDEVDFD